MKSKNNLITAPHLDCLGFPFFGKRRFAEFAIADNSLEAVWILTTKEEEERFRDAMTEEYGSPDKVGKNIEIYSIAGAALRKDKPAFDWAGEWAANGGNRLRSSLFFYDRFGLRVANT